MYPLLESIKIKNGFAYHLSLHQERMERACSEVLNTACEIDLMALIHKLELPDKGLYKCRLLYDAKDFTAEIQAYAKRKINTLKLLNHNSIAYQHKFSERKVLEDLFSQRKNADEIIIVKNGLITDASYANLIFRDGNDWYTPDSPLLKGIQREYLLKKGIITERKISLDDLHHYSSVGLINAMMDFEDKIVLPIESIF